MRLTKLQLVERMGEQAFFALLAMAKQSIEVEGMMKLIEWAQPDPDGTSIDLTDQRFQKLYELEPVLMAQGVVSAGWADAVLQLEPVDPPAPLPTGTARVYRMGGDFTTCAEGEQGPSEYDEVWDIPAVYYAMIAEGATIRAEDGKLAIAKMVG